jgi:hypothetical protein
MALDANHRRVFAVVLPHLLRVLVARGYVTREMLGDGKRLDVTLRKHVRVASERFAVLVALDQDFAREAFDLWDRGRKYPAIVLFATAAEQALNSHYRLVFLASGLTNEEITKIIRTQTLDAKLSWLMRVATNTKFPKPLARRLHTVFELRNSIVHYKAVPGHPDRGDDSHEAIKRRLQELGRISLRRDFRLLSECLDSVLLKHDPSFELAFEAAQQILAYRGYAA